MRRRPEKPMSPIMQALIAEATAAAQRQNEGAFRMGARAMRDAIGSALSSMREDIAQAARDVPLPALAHPKPKPEAKWLWWAGRDEEWYTVGPCADREDAIAEGRADFDGEGFHILEAVQPNVAFCADALINREYFENDDHFSGEHGEPDRIGGADVVAAADAELQALLDGWTARWQHTFVRPEMFAASRGGEWIAPLAAEEWKAAFVKRWFEITGSLDAAKEHADAAWDAREDNDMGASPEECAETEISYAREDGE